MSLLKELIEKEKRITVKKSFACDWDLWLVRMFKRIFRRTKP